MGKNILLVEDDTQIRTILKDYFVKSNFKVLEACDGEEAINIFENSSVDLIILDIMLPKIDGFGVLARIRAKSLVPIIMLTARTEDDDQLLGFRIGADDYVPKPFSFKVLVARAEALLKRSEMQCNKEETNIISISDIEINKLSYQVKVDNNVLDLSPKEYELLLLLVENKGIVLSRETLLNKIWGYDYFGDERAVDTYIKKLRKKLNDKSKYIKTVTGIGYKFEVTNE